MVEKHSPDMKTSLAGRQRQHERSCWSQDQQRGKTLILAFLTIALLGVALFRVYFPALRNELSDVLFIATLVVAMIGFFRGRK
jgi:hypothetical protein